MTAEGGGFPAFMERQRKRWTIYDDRKRIAMHVQLARICWLKKERHGAGAHGRGSRAVQACMGAALLHTSGGRTAHVHARCVRVMIVRQMCIAHAPLPAAGPALYELRAYEPHHARPAIIAAPEDGRLVFRSRADRKQQGDALCEVTFDCSLLGPDTLLPAPSEEDAAGGWRARCHVAIAPRAELPLVLMLLSIYRRVGRKGGGLAWQLAVQGIAGAAYARSQAGAHRLLVFAPGLSAGT